MMDAYTSFAKVYDEFMDNVPYEAWAEQIVKILKSSGIEDGIVADLGCGTGKLTEMLADRGYDMIGIDASEEMLQEAFLKKTENGKDILYLCQDMREFELYGTCRAIISRCDSLNYLNDTDDLVKTFKLVNNYLDPQGLFIFDINSEHKYRDILGDNVFTETRDNGSFIWENDYDAESRTNEYDLTLYVRDELSEKERFVRFEETHIQHAFSIEEVKQAASQAGLRFISVTDADTDEDVTDDTERYLFTFMEQGK